MIEVTGAATVAEDELELLEEGPAPVVGGLTDGAEEAAAAVASGVDTGVAAAAAA